MPFSLDWQDNILMMSLQSPLSEDEMASLREGLQPLAKREEPVYALIDIREFDLMNSIMKLVEMTDGIPMPDINRHMRQSRFAVISTGPAVPMILSVYGHMVDYEDALRNFDSREPALTWLREQAAT